MNASPDNFDVFLSYSSHDRALVEQVARLLSIHGIKVWFDKWCIRPGVGWQEAIEHGIAKSHSVAVFIGSDGLGPWEIPEMRVALSEHVHRGCPVIPVFLTGHCSLDKLPSLLRGHQAIDFTAGPNDRRAAEELVWGITGKKPKGIPEPQSHHPTCEPKPVFIANRIEGTFAHVFAQSVEPVLTSFNLGFATMSNFDRAGISPDLASAAQEAALDARLLIWESRLRHTLDSPVLAVATSTRNRHNHTG